VTHAAGIKTESSRKYHNNRLKETESLLRDLVVSLFYRISSSATLNLAVFPAKFPKKKME